MSDWQIGFGKSLDWMVADQTLGATLATNVVNFSGRPRNFGEDSLFF
jgi:hypothetical protein